MDVSHGMSMHHRLHYESNICFITVVSVVKNPQGSLNVDDIELNFVFVFLALT